MLKEDKPTQLNVQLWQYFTDDAGKIKDRMWTIASFMYTLLAGLTAFAAKFLSFGNNGILKVDNPMLLITVSIMGIVLSSHTLYMIWEYGKHISSMWNRADNIRRQLPELNSIWFLNNEQMMQNDIQLQKKNYGKIPGVAKRLIYLCVGFILVFTLLLFSNFFKN